MPRFLGGHTELGQSINGINQKTVDLNVKVTNHKMAIIKSSYNGMYVFKMQLIEDGYITGPIPIVGSPNELAMRYGSPIEMEGKWEVLISYKGKSVNRGTAQIIKQIGDTIGGEVEEVEQCNQLMVKGTAFAPPGSGMI